MFAKDRNKNSELTFKTDKNWNSNVKTLFQKLKLHIQQSKSLKIICFIHSLNPNGDYKVNFISRITPDTRDNVTGSRLTWKGKSKVCLCVLCTFLKENVALHMVSAQLKWLSLILSRRNRYQASNWKYQNLHHNTFNT